MMTNSQPTSRNMLAADLTGKGTGILCRNILGTELNNAIVDSRRDLGQINVWRANDHIGTGLCRQASQHGADQVAVGSTAAVQLPVSGNKRPSI